MDGRSGQVPALAGGAGSFSPFHPLQGTGAFRLLAKSRRGAVSAGPSPGVGSSLAMGEGGAHW